MKRSPRRDHGFWLLEAMLAVLIFSMGMIALGQCLSNCLVAEHMKEDDLRARQALQNRMIQIESGAVPVTDPVEVELKDSYEGMTIKQTPTPLKRKDEKDQDIVGIYEVKLELAWKSDGQDLSRELSFYVYPRQR